MIFKRLFPNAVVNDYVRESEYLEEIKNSKQQKPDIILCVDVESDNAVSRQNTYSKMLEFTNYQCIFAYHNHLDWIVPSKGVNTVIEVIKGSQQQPALNSYQKSNV